MIDEALRHPLDTLGEALVTYGRISAEIVLTQTNGPGRKVGCDLTCYFRQEEKTGTWTRQSSLLSPLNVSSIVNWKVSVTEPVVVAV